MENFQVPAAEARSEIEVKNSRFIAIAAPAFTVDEAQQFIKRVKSQFPDANHRVSAYIIGHGASIITHCSDAGEPSGTAGRPVLAVISGSGLGDIVVVVTRYFGGTKLGTGGLVRAYGAAAREVLSIVPRAVKTRANKIIITLQYSYYELARNEIVRSGATILNQEFLGEVILEILILLEKYEKFVNNLMDLSNGQAQISILNQGMDVLIPIKSEG